MSYEMRERRAWDVRDDNFDDVCLHVLGRRFRTRPDLAAAFIRRVESTSLHGRPDQTPLLHNRGLEMLYVTASTPMVMHDVRDHSLDGQHRPHGGADARVSGRLPPAESPSESSPLAPPVA
jgi:hypothetical protein